MNAPFTLCIDLDDTLVPNAYLYQIANWQCGAIIQRAIAPFSMLAHKILETEEKLDLANAKRFGFDPRRFAYSWVSAYRVLAKEVGVPVDPRVRRAVHRAASTFKDGPFDTYPHVHETLAALRSSGHRLELLTAGDRALQEKKIAVAGLAPYFHAVQIVPMDKTPHLVAAKERTRGRVAMVGDSKKSDIVPAITAGVIPIWLSRGVQWSFAQADVDHDKFHAIAHFRELPALLANL